MSSLETITRVTDADSAALMVPNTEQGYIFCEDSFNMPREWVVIKNSFEEKVPGGNAEVYNTGKPAITNHICKDLKGHYIESVMIVPVMRNSQVIVMLELVHRSGNKSFSEGDLRVTQDFAKKLEGQLTEQLY